MPTEKQTMSRPLPGSPEDRGERPAVPKGGASETPPKGEASDARAEAVDIGATALAYLMREAARMLPAVERAVEAKAQSYAEVSAMKDAQRSDRAHLMAAVAEVARQGVPSEDAREDDPEWVSEERLMQLYGGAMLEAGLFLLPNVVETFLADQAGNVIVVVEYALADTDGRYWPAAVRVSGMGNDRVAQQRGGTGDKALPRALSGAYKEALCRLLGIPRGNDPELHDQAHASLPAASSRPSNRQSDRPAPMSMAEEDAFRDRVLDALAKAERAEQVDRLMARDDVKEKMKAIGSRARKRIESEAAEVKRRLNPDRGGDRRRDDDRRGQRGGNGTGTSRDGYDEGRDRGDYRDEDRGRDDEEEQPGGDSARRGNYDLDDDIPF